MLVYKKCKRTGYVYELYTEGSYKPKGWSTTKRAAESKK